MMKLRPWYMPVAIATGFCAPALLIALVSYGIAQQAFLHRIDEFSGRVLLRAEMVAGEAQNALAEANATSGPYCGEAHLHALREIERKYRYVREVAYLQGSTLACTSHVADVGKGLVNAADVAAGLDSRFVALRDRQHLVIVDPRFYVDIVPLDNTIQLGVVDTANGQAIARWPHADPEILKQALAGKLDKQAMEGRIFRVVRSKQMAMAVVIYEPEMPFQQAWQKLLYICMPFALAMSLLASWLVLRWARKWQGPRATLLEALRRKQFFVQYQPIIELDTGRCSGAEALVRWRTAENVTVSPATFIPMAESLGLLPQITDVVLAQIARDQGAFLVANPSLHISVNFAASDLQQSDVVGKLTGMVAQMGIRPQQIWVEITESACVNDPVSLDTLNRVHHAGFPIYIDDFGTGYSSLAYLSELPLAGLKVDKMFVDAIGKATATADITEHVIAMAQDLNLNIVAEGIETAEQHAYLKARAVQYGQGWLFARALDAKAFQNFQPATAA